MSGAKELDEEAVRLAVYAHIRHRETDCDSLLMQGVSRYEARAEVSDTVVQVADAWAQNESLHQN